MLKEFGFQTDEVGNEDNNFRVGKMAVMKWTFSWDGRKKKCLSWIRFRFLTSFNISSGGPTRSN